MSSNHCRYPHTGKSASLLALVAVYVAAITIGVETADTLGATHPVAFVLIADVVATLVVFAFSCWYRNASTYDPYWSVIPVLIVLYWMVASGGGSVVLLRQYLVVGLVCLWGVRLTWNWILRWQGLGDEDWRFGMLRKKHGRAYWLVNLGGIHMLPTLLVFAGCLAAWPVIAAANRPINWLDAIALLVTALAIWIEASADRQLREHRSKNAGTRLESGWWGRSRHPNYLGEVLFWWGLYLFALAANPAWWWTGIGALAISALFKFISIPMMDQRMLQKDPGYAQVIKELPAMLPRMHSNPGP
ncbi:MAG: DUF1295 domain-containing protein [Xanthomonadales bacterium]|nr:DUF1295 domain-containing protein [Xanthomonadales bacterium]